MTGVPITPQLTWDGLAHCVMEGCPRSFPWDPTRPRPYLCREHADRSNRAFGTPMTSWPELQYRLTHCDDCDCVYEQAKPGCNCVCHGDVQ